MGYFQINGSGSHVFGIVDSISGNYLSHLFGASCLFGIQLEKANQDMVWIIKIGGGQYENENSG
jgi:hypothetical protein